MTESPASREKHALHITRIFDAPRELVFRMWTEHEHMTQWGCPHGFSIPEATGDIREGGRWRTVMVSAEHGRHVCGGEYREIVPPERLVFTHAWERDDGETSPETVITVVFEAIDGGTRMTFMQEGFESVESRDGHEGGWTEGFERLASHLQNHLPG